MTVLILDGYEADEFIKERKNSPAYRWDEIWDGMYVVPPIPDNPHQELAAFFMVVFCSVYYKKRGHKAGGHVNISDRNKTWLENVRCPDVAVFLSGNPAKNRRTHWQGGPDFLVEVVTPGDRCREKLDFYAKVGSREALVVDRNPWRLELYRLQPGKVKLVGRIKPGDRRKLASAVIPFEFQLLRGRRRPKVKIVHTETEQEWVG